MNWLYKSALEAIPQVNYNTGDALENSQGISQTHGM